MKNLGGWTRLGIVVTLLWMVAVLIELWNITSDTARLVGEAGAILLGYPFVILVFGGRVRFRPPSTYSCAVLSAEPREQA